MNRSSAKIIHDLSFGFPCNFVCSFQLQNQLAFNNDVRIKVSDTLVAEENWNTKFFIASQTRLAKMDEHGFAVNGLKEAGT